MLCAPSPLNSECLSRAAQAGDKAVLADGPNTREFRSEMEGNWLRLASRALI
jgi:hypothetical protein